MNVAGLLMARIQLSQQHRFWPVCILVRAAVPVVTQLSFVHPLQAYTFAHQGRIQELARGGAQTG